MPLTVLSKLVSNEDVRSFGDGPGKRILDVRVFKDDCWTFAAWDKSNQLKQHDRGIFDLNFGD